jgi:TP901 family phage tail tape measure protein
MSTVMTAEAIIRARDATGGVFGAIANKVARISNAAATASRAAAGVGQKAQVIDRVNAGVGRSQMAVAAASARVLGPAAVAYAGARTFARHADADMALTRIGITAEASQGQVDGLRKSLRELAYATGKPFDEVTAGLDNIVASGQSLGDAMKVLPAVTKTAQASGASISDIANTAVALQQSLDIKPENLQSAFDILNTAGKSGKFELKDLARHMASIGPAAKAAGFTGEQGLKKLAAMMETIRAGSGSSEEAADSMTNILQKMESTETAAKFEKLGVDLPKGMAKARKEGRNLVEAFIDLAKVATKGDLSKLPQLIGDLQFARGTRALMSYGDVYEDVLRKVNSSRGSTMGDLDRVLQRPKVAIDKLSESWDRLKESAGAAIASMGAGGGLNKLSSIFEETSDYYSKSEAERARFQSEKQRRSVIDPQVRELKQKIETEERAEREKTSPSWLDRLRGKKELEPIEERLNTPLLQDLRSRLFALEASRNVEMPSPEKPLMSDPEVKAVLDEIERKKLDAVIEFPRKEAGKGVPLPTRDPRSQFKFPEAGDDAEGLPRADAADDRRDRATGKPDADAADDRRSGDTGRTRRDAADEQERRVRNERPRADAADDRRDRESRQPIPAPEPAQKRATAPVTAAPDLSDIWSKGTKGIEQLDGSGQAGAAGAKTAAAYKSNFASELQGVDALIDAAVARWAAKLGSFSASPSINPSFGSLPAAPSAPAGGSKGASLERLKSSQHAAFADYGIGTVG